MCFRRSMPSTQAQMRSPQARLTLLHRSPTGKPGRRETGYRFSELPRIPPRRAAKLIMLPCNASACAVNCNAVWCRAVQCSVAQCGTVWCSTAQCGARSSHYEGPCGRMALLRRTAWMPCALKLSANTQIMRGVPQSSFACVKHWPATVNMRGVLSLCEMLPVARERGRRFATMAARHAGTRRL